MRRDLILHFVAGVVIALAASFTFSPTIGLTLAIAAGVAKEVWDAQGNGTVDPLDAIATALGGLLIYGVLSWIV